MVSGGKRQGAGRPKGKGPFGEATQAIRVPVSLVGQIKEFAAHKGYKLPLYTSRVQAGVPTIAEEHVEDYVDLNSYFVKNPADTMLILVSGDSMKDAGINDGDLLIVDRKIKPAPGKIVVASVDGLSTVKYLKLKNGKAFLVPANSDFEDIPIDPESGVVILGVVINSIKSH